MNRNENEIVNDPFKVFVRIRPFLERELIIDKDNEKSIKDRERDRLIYNKNGIKVEENMVNQHQKLIKN
jgi:hypothetical protein